MRLEVVWKDDDMFELEVTATNGSFLGTTRVYAVSDSLYAFAQSLVDYPKANNSPLSHKIGEPNGHSYFSMKFYPIDNVGHLGVQVALESKITAEQRLEKRDRVTLEILTEPGLLDNFVKSLLTLAKNEEGQALLEGVT